MAEDAVFVERDAAIRRKVVLDFVKLGHRVVAGNQARIVALDRFHANGEGVAQPLDKLEQRGVDVAPLVAEHKGAVMGRQRILEIAEELRDTLLAKILRCTHRCILLLVVVEVARDRVVDVVRFGDDVADGQLQHDELEIAVEIACTEPMLLTRPRKDMRDLRDAEIAIDEVGRGVGANAAALVQVVDQSLRSFVARAIAIFDARSLKREPHEFAATLNARPVP